MIRVATAAITSNPNLIAITDQVFVRGFKWASRCWMICARRMLRNVEVQDAPTIMTDN
jgi:hypothetical protein